MCLAQGPQCSDAVEAQTRGLSVSRQALYHLATALPTNRCLTKVPKSDEQAHLLLFFVVLGVIGRKAKDLVLYSK